MTKRPNQPRRPPRPKNRPRYDVAILIGGRGLRMGGLAKGRLKIEGVTLINRLASLAPGRGSVFLVGAAQPEDEALGLRMVADLKPGFGAPGGLFSAAEGARAPWVFAVACDMPRVHPTSLELLLERAGPGVSAVAFEGDRGPRPFPALIRASALRKLRPLISSGISARALLARLHPVLVPVQALANVDPGLETFESVNRPEDLIRLRIDIGK